MLKQTLMSALFVALGTASSVAQQQDVILQKVEIPGAAYDIVFAMSRPVVISTVRAKHKNPLVIHPIGGELAYAVQGEIESMFKEVGYPLLPLHAFRIEMNGLGSSTARLNVYVLPRHGPPVQ